MAKQKSNFKVVPGRIVSYSEDGKSHPALIVKVWSPETVNLVVFDDLDPPPDDGKVTDGRTSVVRGEGDGQWLPPNERQTLEVAAAEEPAGE